MKLRFLIMFFLLLHSCNKKNEETDCTGIFSSIGVLDFKIGNSINEIEDKIYPIKLEFQNVMLENFRTYAYTDFLNYRNNKYKVIYYFTFYQSSLIMYHFDIEANKKIFDFMVNDLDKKRNPIVNLSEKNKLSYFLESKYCKTFFYLIYRDESKLCISGGVERK
jgi:hypothetical protein